MAKSTTPRVRYKPVVDFPGYRVGDDGSVWSKWHRIKRTGYRTGWAVALKRRWWKMQQSTDGHGYPLIHLYRNKKRFTLAVHLLVLKAFVGPCPPGQEAAHEDGDKTNCHLTNLQWKTHIENMADCKRHGTMIVGEDHPGAKLTVHIVKRMRRLRKKGLTLEAIADICGSNFGRVGRVVRGEIWKHVC